MKDVDSSSPRRPRILAVLPAFIPSTILTVVKPLTALHRARHIVADITLEPFLSDRKVRRADLVVFSRNTSPHALDAVLAQRKPIIYDIDDNLFEIPKAYGNALGPAELAGLERYLTTADFVRAYSEPLRQRLLQLNPRTHRVDCAIDTGLLPEASPPRDPHRVRIVYATSRWQKDELAALFTDDLHELLHLYGDRVQLFFWGYLPPELRGHHSVRFLEYEPDYDRFFRNFARAGFDIGLAPLRDDDFHRAKCNNKFREYAACRIAGVYSGVDVYSSCVEDGRTGLMVSGERGAWFRAISRLIEDAQLRANIQEGAYRVVRERYSPEKSQAVWLAHINEVIGGAWREEAPGTVKWSEETALQSSVRPPEAPSRVRLAAGAVKRLARLPARVRAGGGRAAIQWARLYVSSFRELLRVRRRLLSLPWRSARMGVIEGNRPERQAAQAQSRRAL